MRTPEVENAMRCRIRLHSHALSLDAVAAVLHRTCDATLIAQAAYYLRALEPLAAEVERLEDLHRMQLAGISTATLQNTVASTADRILKDNPYWTIAYGDVCTAVDREIAQRVRAEAAEARVRELEAQYACKRHNGEEAPEAAAQLTDDMLRSCQICGLTVDISKGHCEPTIEFTMQGRTDKKTKKLAELEAQNAQLREALEGLQSDAQCTLDLYNKNGPTWTSRDSGEEYYSASYVIDSTEERIATIKAALTDTKGTP